MRSLEPLRVTEPYPSLSEISPRSDARDDCQEKAGEKVTRRLRVPANKSGKTTVACVTRL